MDQILLLHAEKGVANGFIVVVWTGGRVVKGLALSFIVQIVISADGLDAGTHGDRAAFA